MRYLTKAQIIRLNEATVKAHGGNYMPPSNFLHEENLDYLVEAVQADRVAGADVRRTVVPDNNG